MKPILLLLLPLLAQVAPCGLQEDIDSCILLKASLKVQGRQHLERGIVLKDPTNPENVQICIEGSGDPVQFEGSFPEAVFSGDNLKDCHFRNIGVWNHIGGGWQVNARDTAGHAGSASRNSWTGCRVQGPGIGWFFNALNGADISCTKLDSCDAQGSEAALKVVGSNALNILCVNLTGSNVKVGADLTQGGSDSRFVQGGFSYAGTGWLVNPGYQLTIDGATMEATGIVVDTGSGTGSGMSLKFSDIRNCGTLLKSGQNGATRIVLSALKVTAGTKVTMTGDSGQGYLELFGAASTCKVSAPKYGVVKKTGVAGFVSASGG